MTIPESFRACCEVKNMKDGTTEIHCKLGLWSVCGEDRVLVDREAFHYWIQYFQDGEYSNLLSSPIEQEGGEK